MEPIRKLALHAHFSFQISLFKKTIQRNNETQLRLCSITSRLIYSAISIRRLHKLRLKIISEASLARAPRHRQPQCARAVTTGTPSTYTQVCLTGFYL